MALFPLHLIPNDTKFDFMRLRWVASAVFGLIALVCIGSITYNQVVKGAAFNYALDFTGGIEVGLSFEKPADVDGVRKRLEAAGIDGASVTTRGSGSDLTVRLQSPDGKPDDEMTTRVARQVVEAASTADNPAKMDGRSFIGSQVGKDLSLSGIYAAIFVAVGFLIYISFRFEWKFAVVATVTTLNDVLLVAGFFALTGREFDLTVLAGLLSVMGFSVNDTIVVFDRVRENFRTMRADPLTVLNTSINQTLSRTIITALVFFLAVLALYLYGGGSLEGLAISQMIAAVFGTLSSIFIACPLLTFGFLKVTKQDLMPKAKDIEALARRP